MTLKHAFMQRWPRYSTNSTTARFVGRSTPCNKRFVCVWIASFGLVRCGVAPTDETCVFAALACASMHHDCRHSSGTCCVRAPSRHAHTSIFAARCALSPSGTGAVCAHNRRTLATHSCGACVCVYVCVRVTHSFYERVPWPTRRAVFRNESQVLLLAAACTRCSPTLF